MYKRYINSIIIIIIIIIIVLFSRFFNPRGPDYLGAWNRLRKIILT